MRCRHIAVEDAARYRDAGIVPAPGTPTAFLEPVTDAVGQLIARYARDHGPFPESALSVRYGLSAQSISEVVARLRQSGRLVSGAFLAGGQGDELCDSEVLRTLPQRSLAHLRRERALAQRAQDLAVAQLIALTARQSARYGAASFNG